jgi:hypothetical protein
MRFKYASICPGDSTGRSSPPRRARFILTVFFLGGRGSAGESARQNHEPSILAKVSVDRERLLDLQTLNHNKAEDICQGIVLVLVVLQQVERSPFISHCHAFDQAETTPRPAEKLHGVVAAIPGPIQKEGMGFIEDGIGRDELPALVDRARKNTFECFVRGVVRDDGSEERAGVNEDAPHFSWLSA